MIDPATLTNRGPELARGDGHTPCRARVTFSHGGVMVEAGTLLLLPSYMAERLIRDGTVERFVTHHPAVDDAGMSPARDRQRASRGGRPRRAVVGRPSQVGQRRLHTEKE
jgi:hypothetical protein